MRGAATGCGNCDHRNCDQTEMTISKKLRFASVRDVPFTAPPSGHQFLWSPIPKPQPRLTHKPTHKTVSERPFPVCKGRLRWRSFQVLPWLQPQSSRTGPQKQVGPARTRRPVQRRTVTEPLESRLLKRSPYSICCT